MELQLLELAFQQDLPVLGICRGIQLLNVCFGGTLYQDLPEQVSNSISHHQTPPYDQPVHTVSVLPETPLAALLEQETLAVNSYHHQGILKLAEALQPMAVAPDGLIESVWLPEKAFVWGVQWHPECFILEGDRRMQPLFEHFVGQAAAFRRVRKAHSHILTLDSHCDTPMFFNKGVDLTHRDPQLLVDFPKMREGMLDATIMVAYLPQGELTDEEHRAANEQAVQTLGEIERRVAEAPGVALAQSVEQLYENKRKGMLSVMRGIENGYALGTDLEQVERFARMGIVYITLCHNGDNLICDSARRSQQLHGGLSAFGREVIREMNRCGVMVDLSHAAETSFYQALEVSELPIVCSHSSSRALCDHPRNLTDDQLRALAATGGVAQVTLYEGFLHDAADGRQATIDDAVRHLLHMVEVAGIDHVGIGTDFDGDGGVPGLASTSELPNFTRRLLEEGFTEQDLEKVWGRNFLRVMALYHEQRKMHLHL